MNRQDQRERSWGAPAVRGLLICGISVLAGALSIYLLAPAALMGSAKTMVRAQRDGGHRDGTKAGVIRSAPPRAAATPGTIDHRLQGEAHFASLGFDTLGNFPIKVTQLMFQSADGSGGPSEVDAQIPDSIRRCDGQRVAVRGFMLPQRFDHGIVTEFLLLKNQGLCCYGAIPRMNEWIVVHTVKGTRAIMDQPITVRGCLRVGEIREDGFLTGIYKMEAEP